MRNFLKLLLLGVMILSVNNIEAQGFLKKLKNAATSAVSKVTKKTSDTTTTTTSTEEASASTSAVADTTKTIAWDQVPIYTAKLCNVTDAKGNAVKNADGTQKVRVFLVDQFGNKRSKEAVEAQHKKLKKLTGTILAKVGGGAVLGAATGLLTGKGVKGAVIGTAAGGGVGALASISNIKEAKKIKKSLKQQDALLETYAQNFTSEGEPIDASVDVSSLKGLDLNAENTLSMSTDEINKMVSDSSFSTTDDSAWDINI